MEIERPTFDGSKPFHKVILLTWKSQLYATWWVAKKYWPATILGVGGLVFELTGRVDPVGIGMSLFLGWFLLFVLLAQDIALNGNSGP